MQLFSADAIVFSKKLKKKIFDPKKVKKRALKVAHNQPRHFYFTVQPRPQPTAQNWSFILWNLGTRHLFSYLWSHTTTSFTHFCKSGILNVKCKPWENLEFLEIIKLESKLSLALSLIWTLNFAQRRRIEQKKHWNYSC